MNRRSLIRIWIIVVIIWLMWFSSRSFAADWTNDGDVSFVLGYGLNVVVNLLAWVWVFFAKIAWEFLTNKWVYGEVFWWDVLLWKFWNVAKNIANFWLGFYFVYMILKWLLDQYKWTEITKKLKDTILWILIAWIWIQSSWFLTAAVIDVSTVTLVAAWSFPSHVISDSTFVDRKMKIALKNVLDPNKTKVTSGMLITIDPTNAQQSTPLKKEYVSLEEPESYDKFLDKIMPNESDISWPLLFIWTFILDTNVITAFKNTDKKDVKTTIMNTIIQWGTTIVYAVEMLVLCVVAFLRIIYLWMFIAASPVVILIWCMDKASQKQSGDSIPFMKSFTKHLNFSSFFVNAFKPTIIVLGIWLATIFATLMNWVVEESVWNTIEHQWVTFTTSNCVQDNSGNEWNKICTNTMDGNTVHFILANAWKTLLGLIMSIMTVILIYFIIRISVTMWWWSDFVSDKIKKAQDIAWSIFGSIPIPIGKSDKEWKPLYLSAKKIFDTSTGRSELLERKFNSWQEKIDQLYSEQDSAIRSLFGDDTGYLSATEKNSITNAWYGLYWIEILKAKKNAIKKSDEWKWMKLNPQTASNDGFWIKQFEEWLKNPKTQTITWTNYDRVWEDMINRWNTGNNKDGGLEQNM